MQSSTYRCEKHKIKNSFLVLTVYNNYGGHSCKNVPCLSQCKIMLLCGIKFMLLFFSPNLIHNSVQFKHQLTVLPPLPMTLPAAVEGTLMCVSSLTSSFAVKKFSSFSFPNIRPWAWNKEEGMRQGETGENGDTK